MTTLNARNRGPEFGFATETFNLIADRLPALTHDKPGCPCGCGTIGICAPTIAALPDPSERRRALAGRLTNHLRARLQAAGAELKKSRGTAPLALHDEDSRPYGADDLTFDGEVRQQPTEEPPLADLNLLRCAKNEAVKAEHENLQKMMQRAAQLARDPATWARFARALAATPLSDAGSGKRIADVNEFMLMHVTKEGSIGFKHRGSRNYVFLFESGTLYVPVTEQPFMHGTF